MKALKNSEITALLGSTPETGSVKVRFSSPITVTMQPMPSWSYEIEVVGIIATEHDNKGRSSVHVIYHRYDNDECLMLWSQFTAKAKVEIQKQFIK